MHWTLSFCKANSRRRTIKKIRSVAKLYILQIVESNLKDDGSSTKGLIMHFKLWHKNAAKSNRVEVAKTDEPKFKIRNVDSFLNRKADPRELISQLTAISRLTFNQIATSERLCQAFKAVRSCSKVVLFYNLYYKTCRYSKMC